jgi:siderophore synthetase component
VFRYLDRIFERHLDVPSADFWSAVRATIRAYQERFPEHADRYQLFDLTTPQIDRLCLNRNRLLLNGYRDRADRPHVEAHGVVPNPLSPPDPVQPDAIQPEPASSDSVSANPDNAVG